MNIKTKYNIGEKVYICKESTEVCPCDICKETGIVKLNNQIFTCPACNGNTTRLTVKKHIPSSPLFIKAIQVFTCENKVDGFLQKTSYSLSDNTTYNEFNVFATLEDVKNKCKELDHLLKVL